MTDQRHRPYLEVLVVSIILILLLGYYSNDPFVIGDAFHLLRAILYIAVPLLLNAFYFKISWRELGFAIPSFNKKTKSLLIIAAVLIPALIFLVRLSPTYLSSYPMYQDPATSAAAKLIQFSIFTFSTLIGWEILLRGFFLFGLRFLLENQYRIKRESAESIAILWVATFEVLYHFVKPDLEALGMLVASPILSWLAFRTKSFIVPMVLHLYIEFVFILVVIFS